MLPMNTLLAGINSQRREQKANYCCRHLPLQVDHRLAALVMAMILSRHSE
jgi:hypothetical protein